MTAWPSAGEFATDHVLRGGMKSAHALQPMQREVNLCVDRRRRFIHAHLHANCLINQEEAPRDLSMDAAEVWPFCKATCCHAVVFLDFFC